MRSLVANSPGLFLCFFFSFGETKYTRGKEESRVRHAREAGPPGSGHSLISFVLCRTTDKIVAFRLKFQLSSQNVKEPRKNEFYRRPPGVPNFFFSLFSSLAFSCRHTHTHAHAHARGYHSVITCTQFKGPDNYRVVNKLDTFVEAT